MGGKVTSPPGDGNDDASMGWYVGTMDPDPVGGTVVAAGGRVALEGRVVSIGGGVGCHPMAIGAFVVGGLKTGGDVGLGVIGALSPLLTSKEVPYTLEISAMHGSLTTSTAPA